PHRAALLHGRYDGGRLLHCDPLGGLRRHHDRHSLRRGMSLRQVVKDYHACAGAKASVDYAFHLIISDPTDQVTGQELPALIKDGYTSFKIYMTYDALKLDDRQILEVLSVARRKRALAMVQSE